MCNSGLQRKWPSSGDDISRITLYAYQHTHKQSHNLVPFELIEGLPNSNIGLQSLFLFVGTFAAQLV